MTRTYEERPRVANRDRHVARKAPWNAKPMKKSGKGKGNWGVEGDEIEDYSISVNQVFQDSDYRDDDLNQETNNKIRVISKAELEGETEEISSSSSSEE